MEKRADLSTGALGGPYGTQQQICTRRTRLKLTQQQIGKIVRMRISGKTFQEIGDAFDIDPSYAQKLYSGTGRANVLSEQLRRRAIERQLKKLEEKGRRLKEELAKIQ
jgi:hypothetical protein